MLCHVVVFFLVFFVRKAAQRTGGKRGIRHKLVLKGSGAKRQKKHPLPSDARRGVFFFFLLFFSDLISLSLFSLPSRGKAAGGTEKEVFFDRFYRAVLLSIAPLVFCFISVSGSENCGEFIFSWCRFFFPRKERKEKKTVVFLGLKRHGPSCSC